MYNTEDAERGILVARTYTEAVEHAVQQGARLLLLPGGAPRKPGRTLPFGHIVPRDGTQWQGDWATSFAWLRKEGPFAHLPGEPLLEMEYAAIMPDEILVGIPAWASHASWAGLALGWIHWASSLLASGPYGKGRFTVSTFKLSTEVVGDDPIAQGVLAGLVVLAAQD